MESARTRSKLLTMRFLTLTASLAGLATLCVIVPGGCNRGKDDASAGGQAATQAADATTAAPMVRIGLPHATKEQYKPAVGRYGGRLVRDQLGEPKSFNPIVASETSTTDYTQRMFEGLTRSNAFTGDDEPGLAESWEVAPDGLTWTFKLRKDVTFNDGTPFTAEDVVFTWNDLVYDLNRPADKKEPRWPCSFRDLTTFDGKIIKVEAPDAYTVKFTTPVKIAIMPSLVGEPMLCSKKKYAPKVADGSFGGAMSSDAKTGDVVATGPWMLGEYVRGERVVLKRNPNY